MITRSSLVLRDEEKKSVTRLHGLEVHTGALSGSEPVDAEIKFDYDEGAAPPLAQVAAKARVQMLNDGARLEVKNLDAQGKWFGAPVKDLPAQPAAIGKRKGVTVSWG